jgi:hypothetical protein
MVSTMSLRVLFRDRSSRITAFISCAKNQLETEDKKIGFSKKALNGSALRGIAKDIISSLSGRGVAVKTHS